MLFYPKSKIVFSFFPALPICLLKSVAYLQSLLAYISKTPAKLVESLPSSFDLWIFWAKSLDLFLLNCLLGPIKFALIAFFLWRDFSLLFQCSLDTVSLHPYNL